MRSLSTSSQDGFTLIEVLVAFVILVAALPVLYGIFSGGLRGAALAGDYQRAVAFAEAELAASAIADDLRHGQRRTSRDGPYTLDLSVSDYRPWADLPPTQPLPVRAYHLKLDVGWEQHGRPRSISLSTIVLRPADAGVGG